MKRTLIAFAGATLLFPSWAVAEEQCGDLLYGHDAQIATILSVKVETDDQVTDGCWARPVAASDAVELFLINNSNLAIGSNTVIPTRLALSAVGYQWPDTQNCVVYAEFSADKPLATIIPYSTQPANGSLLRSLEYNHVWRTRTILSGSKVDMQRRITEFMEEAVLSFVLARKKAQQTVFEECPQIGRAFSGALAEHE